jgi:hypothetical protein
LPVANPVANDPELAFSLRDGCPQHSLADLPFPHIRRSQGCFTLMQRDPAAALQRSARPLSYRFIATAQVVEEEQIPRGATARNDIAAKEIRYERPNSAIVPLPLGTATAAN